VISAEYYTRDGGCFTPGCYIIAVAETVLSYCLRKVHGMFCTSGFLETGTEWVIAYSNKKCSTEHKNMPQAVTSPLHEIRETVYETIVFHQQVILNVGKGHKYS
jgi:hypothetical protein